ncbi:MAG: hypothetical protein V3S01_07080 [Dehalococcoidia bacterium]
MKPGSIRERVKSGTLDPMEAASWLRLRSETGHRLSPKIIPWLHRQSKTWKRKA